MEVIPESINQLNTDLNLEESRIRRPPNAFMIFGKQYRRVLAQKFDNLSNKQISIILGNEWNKMEPNIKSHYHNLAKEAYRTHLEKHPDYHYNPLVARQRKAERKRKCKISRVSVKSKANAQFVYPTIKPFGGNRSLSLPNTTFTFSETPTVRYIRPIINKGTGDSVIGIKRLSERFTSPEVAKEEVAPIEHKEHNYSIYSRSELCFSENITFESNSEPPLNENEVQTQQTNNEIDWNQSFDFLVNFLPPMTDPNTEVTPVFQDCVQQFGQTFSEYAKQRIDSIKCEFGTNEGIFDSNRIDAIKQEEQMSEEEVPDNNPIIGEQMDLDTFVKKEIKIEIMDTEMEQLFNKEPKVVVQRIPQ